VQQQSKKVQTAQGETEKHEGKRTGKQENRIAKRGSDASEQNETV
jgi:hypothetical protein